MKKLFLLALPLLAMAFGSCSKDDDNKGKEIDPGNYSEAIIGTWVITQDTDAYSYGGDAQTETEYYPLSDGSSYSYTFHSDGTYDYHEVDSYGGNNFSDNYTVSGNQLIFTGDTSDSNYTETIQTLTSDQLVLVYEWIGTGESAGDYERDTETFRRVEGN